MLTIRDLISGNKLKRHLYFCTAVLALLLLGIYLLYIGGFRFDRTEKVFNCLFLFIYIYAGRWLCGRWYLTHHVFRFVVYVILISAGLAAVNFLFVVYVFHHPNAGFIELLYGTTPFFMAGLITGVLLKLISFLVQKELREASIKAEQKESELNLLQSQLSPHFLFNVLNNLYGISIEEHQRIPGLLLKLSNLLRYSVYGSGKQFVPLKDELEYVKNYIEFEQIRISDRLLLTTDIEQVNDVNISIAPLVLIVFVENAFKHAKNSLTQKIDISISLNISGDFICFKVSNSCQNPEVEDAGLRENSGLGLANTIKRLHLLYGDDHNLIQEKSAERYQIELRLKIKYQK